MQIVSLPYNLPRTEWLTKWRALQSNKRLEKERARLLCLAKLPFDDSNLMHLRLLQSVYLSFTGETGPVGRYVHFTLTNPICMLTKATARQSKLMQPKFGINIARYLCHNSSS